MLTDKGAGAPPGLTGEKGLGNNSDRTQPGNGKADEKANGGKVQEEECPEGEEEEAAASALPGKSQGQGKALGLAKQAGHKKLKLQEETTSYLYDGLGLNLLKEYKGLSAPKAEYYYANGQVLGRKMFGLKDSILPEREPGLANGGTYWYLTNALGSVTDLVDHQGDVARQYRYDAFGGLFTGTVGVYNTHGLTGKTYDAKSGLMDYAARWYDPTTGRFTQKDPYSGTLDEPMSQHRYSYVWNNPVNYTDPTGMATCTDKTEILGIIWRWSCTERVVEGTEQAPGGYWEYGNYVTTSYFEARVQDWEQNWWTNSGTEGEPTYSPFRDWVEAATPPPNPAPNPTPDPPPPPPPPPDPRIEQERQRQEARQVMTSAGGYLPSSYGADTTEFEGFWGSGSRSSTTQDTSGVTVGIDPTRRVCGGGYCVPFTEAEREALISRYARGHCYQSEAAQLGCSSDLLGMTPYVGDVKDAQELLYGLDLVTGQKLTPVQQGLTALAFALPVVGGSLLRKLAPSTTKVVKEYDVVPYRPANSPLENHHGVMDAWAKHNIPGYNSYAPNSPTIALSQGNDEATKEVFREWSRANYGRPVGAKVDWANMHPRQAQELTEAMFDAARVPETSRREFYGEFHTYIYETVVRE